MKRSSRSTNRKAFSRWGGASGFTVVELMIAMAIMLAITPAIMMLFTTTMEGFRADDAENQLKKANQETMLRFYLTLSRNKRIFGRNGAGVSMVGRLNLSGSPPVTVTGTDNQFPVVNFSGSPDPTNAAFLSTDWGNMLLLLVAEGRITCGPVTNNASVAKTIQIDTYRYYFYYLDWNNGLSNSLTGGFSSRLVEWRSQLLVDWGQLQNIRSQDASLGNNLRTFLANRPANAQPITLAVDYSANLVSDMIYNLGSGFPTVADPNVLVSKDWAPAGARATRGFDYLTRIPYGIMGNASYRFGITPNSVLWDRSVQTVPRFATAAGRFPGGFEVCVVGTTGGRQVTIRHALSAQGAFGARRTVIGSELTSTFTCKDVY